MKPKRSFYYSFGCMRGEFVVCFRCNQVDDAAVCAMTMMWSVLLLLLLLQQEMEKLFIQFYSSFFGAAYDLLVKTPHAEKDVFVV